MSKTILVIGGTSTAGAYYVYHLLKKTDYNVISTYRILRENKDECAYRYHKMTTKQLARLKEIELDLNWDKDMIDKLLKETKADYIVNFASLCMVNQSWRAPTDWLTTNIIGQTKLCESIVQNGQIEKYIHFTTPEVYGNSPNEVLEESEHRPSTPYSLSRSTGDKITRMILEQADTQVIFTRAASIYAETQHLYRLIPRVLLYCAHGIDFQIEGVGDTVRQYVHMEDISNAMMILLNKTSNDFSEYHIANTESYSVNDIVKLCLAEYGKSEDYRHIKHSKARKADDK